MQNEQCGICWDLKFDKQGDKTHEEYKDYSHNFVPLDHCVKCKEPKYDLNGFQTHPNETHDFTKIHNNAKSHKFISGNLTKYQEKQKRKKIVSTYIGITFITVGITSLSILFF
jgi:hypothetical protein